VAATDHVALIIVPNAKRLKEQEVRNIRKKRDVS
jgi:hypothetical protein